MSSVPKSASFFAPDWRPAPAGPAVGWPSGSVFLAQWKSIESEDPCERADVLADILGDERIGGGAGDGTKTWDESKVQRDQGRFAAFAGSGERKVAAAARARSKVQEILAGDKSPEAHAELEQHLHELTIEQLHDLKKEHGLQASAADKQALVQKLAGRLSGKELPKAPKAAKPKTLFQVVNTLRGISRAALGRDWNIKEDFFDAGLGGIFVKSGGVGLDDMADQLVRSGHLLVPENRNADDYLMEQLKGKAISARESHEAELQEQERAYYEELQRVHELGTECGEVDAASRGAQEAEAEGGRDATHAFEDWGPHQDDRGMADEEGSRHAGDVDFDFGANEKPEAPPPLRGKDIFGTDWGDPSDERRGKSLWPAGGMFDAHFKANC